MQDCLFCKMAAGDIPVSKVYEDDTVLAFHDIDPLSKISARRGALTSPVGAGMSDTIFSRTA